MGRVQGKVALVSGGASGIGAASCRLLAREGAHVLVADVREDPAQGVVEEIKAAGGSAVFQPLDVRSEEAWAAATAHALESFGALNVVFNNAGVGFPMGNAETQTLEDWRTVMSVNSDGVFLGVKHAIQAMRRCGQPGSIINTSSIVGIVGLAASAAYTASKGAVRVLTKSAALYCAREGLPIRVNSVHPGYIETDMVTTTLSRANDYEGRLAQVTAMIPTGRLGQPEDIGNGVLFLASDESRYMTGAELVIDGGYTAQ